MAERCDLCGSDGNEDIYFEDIKTEFGGESYQIGACCSCAAGLLNTVLDQLPQDERGGIFKDGVFSFVVNKSKKNGVA